MVAYATVEEYRVRTGATVTPESAARLTALLDDSSALVRAYLAANEPNVLIAFPEVLRALVVNRVRRLLFAPPGVRSESIGPSSVTFTDDVSLDVVETALLNRLAGRRNLRSVAYSYE